jgi:putative tryptophan/tyrosine transport system substrate-binding protein
MTTRRQVLLASALAAFAPAFSFAQARPVKIGVLSARAKSMYTAPVMKRLAELGYGGLAVSLEYRHADGAIERFPPLARELSKLKCDVILAIGSHHTLQALKQAGTTVPVVFIAADYDPVERRLVDSLARPGGNVTGVYGLSLPIAVKRVELAQEVTSAGHFLVLSDAYSEDTLSAVKAAAEARGVQLTVAKFAQRPYGYEAAFESGRRSDVRAVIVLTSPVFGDERAVISALAVKHRLPSVGFVLDDAFLIGHSASATKMAQRAAEIVASILKGAKPADIPVHQADEFDLVINLRTAKALNIKIPQSVMARATRIVE